MTIFDYLGDILVKKKGDLPIEEYVPFMINRWLSFSSSSACQAINESVNSFGNLDKNIHYKLLISAFPKHKFLPRISYIKKIKNVKINKYEYNFTSFLKNDFKIIRYK